MEKQAKGTLMAFTHTSESARSTLLCVVPGLCVCVCMCVSVCVFVCVWPRRVGASMGYEMKGDFHCFCNFNWRIIPLQYWVGFCCTTTRISHNYIWTVLYLVAQSGPTLCDPMNCSLPASSVPGDSPDKTTGVGCLSLLQGIFPNQGLNPCFLHCRQILYHLSHHGWGIKT